MEDSTYNKAFFHVTNSKNEDVTSTLDDYTIESSDDNILIATGNVADGATLTPVKIGQAFLIVKNGDGAVVQTLSISVVAKRVLSDLTLDKTTVTIATNASLHAVAKDVINVKAKDQYGDDITLNDLTSEYKNASSDDAKAAKAKIKVTDDENKKTILVATDDEAVKGTYNYIVTGKSGDKSITKAYNIVVKEYKGTESYAIVLTKGEANGTNAITSFDSTITDKTADEDADLKAYLALKKNGVISKLAPLASDTVSCVAIKVVGPESKVYVNTGVAVKTADVKTSAAIDDDEAKRMADGTHNDLSIKAVKYDSSNTTFEKNLPAGTYTITYTLRTKDKAGKAVETPIQKSFTVKDTQAATTAVVKKTSVDTSTIDNVFTTPDIITFTYGGANLVNSDGNKTWKYTSKEYKVTPKDKKLVVEKVTISVPVPKTSGTSDRYVRVTVPVNKVFTGNGDWS